jgi:shikimate kinase
VAAYTEPVNIILTGFMGTGKSTVGRAVADLLHYEFVDTDEVIEDQHGPITGVFAVKGEDGFRAIEGQVAEAAASRRNAVIATGGGTMLDIDNAHVLERSGLVYTLTAGIDQIMDRVEADGIESRPMFDDVEDPRAKVSELLEERADTYDQYPQIDTDGRTPDEIAEEIVADIETRRKAFAAANQHRTVFGLPLTKGLVVGLLTAAVFLLVGILLINRAAPERFNGITLADAIDVPAAAPDADQYVQLDAKLTTGDAVDRAIATRVRELATVPGSATHIGTVTSRLGSREIYTWSADSGSLQVPCIGVLSATAGSNLARCFSADEGTIVETDTRIFDDGNLHLGTLRAGDPNFRWLTATTSDGSVIVTDVVNGVAQLEWIGDAPVAYEAFDEALTSVWTAEVG